MIRYPTTKAALEAAAEKRKKGWLAKAAARTKHFEKIGSYDEKTGIWSEIKDVFIELQKSKCAFCERALEAKKEIDIEHFRPKGNVAPWPAHETLPADLAFSGAADGTDEAGYYLLPYHLQNYSIACAQCNSVLKRDYFPIRGKRRSTAADPAPLAKQEKAYLIFPIGDIDEDPETLIGFHGLSPYAMMDKRDFTYDRAIVTIAFFELDDHVSRKEIFRGRAEAITDLGDALTLMDFPGISATAKANGQRTIAYRQSPAAMHTSCARAFVRLWKSDRQTAEKLWTDASKYLDSISQP